MKKLMIPCLVVLVLSACGGKEQPVETEEPEIAEVYQEQNTPTESYNVAFLAIDGVYNSELMAPFDIFQHTIYHAAIGLNTFIVSPTTDIITTFEGIRITPDYDFDNVPDIDVLVVPSAEHNMDSDLENETLINFVRDKGQNAKYIMSLCDGAFILAKAGLLDEVQSTTFPSDIPRFRETFPQLDVKEGVSFVHDGKAITSAGGAKSYDPALYLVEYLYDKEIAQGVAGGLVIDWKLREIEAIYPRIN